MKFAESNGLVSKVSGFNLTNCHSHLTHFSVISRRKRRIDHAIICSLPRLLRIVPPAALREWKLWFPGNSHTEGSLRLPRSRWRHNEYSTRPRSHHPLSTDRGSEGYRVASCTDTRRFSVSRRSFQHEPSPYPTASSYPLSTPPRTVAPLLAQALVLFRGLRPILIHISVSTVLSSSCRTLRISLFVASSCDYERQSLIIFLHMKTSSDICISLRK